jgi:hypothetical protein
MATTQLAPPVPGGVATIVIQTGADAMAAEGLGGMPVQRQRFRRAGGMMPMGSQPVQMMPGRQEIGEGGEVIKMNAHPVVTINKLG